jgi:hypothetical protein
MKYLFYGLFFFISHLAFGQIDDSEELGRRKATKEEVSKLAHLADSVLNELENLYKLEVKENSPRKYQPERIAFVRSYLLVYQSVESGAGVVSYSSKDIYTIFGKPDTIITSLTNKGETQWLYGKIQTKYVRINNLRYRFYFKNNVLEMVKRDDR